MEKPVVDPTGLLAALGLTQMLPVVLIVGGATLLLVAIWRGQRKAEGTGSAPELPDRAVPANGQLQSVLRDSEQLASILAEQMDQKAARLERLIADADARIRRLERLGAEAPATRSFAITEATDPLNRQVYEMADEGVPVMDIARQLNQQTGKIELILALRQR